MYEYHVFISYRRGEGDVKTWVRNHFYERLRRTLDENVDYDVKIFLDDDVSVGGKWPDEVRDALRRARILIPVCSPKYFRDEWCQAEWHSMAKREELVGMDAAKKPHRLIYPVVFSDSENFPSYARERRMRSLKAWNQPFPQFQNTVEYLDFNRAMEDLVTDLVKVIESAPPWRPEWPVETPPPDQLKPPKLPRF